MDFEASIELLQTLVVALGAGLGVWGFVNLLKGYGSEIEWRNKRMIIRRK